MTKRQRPASGERKGMPVDKQERFSRVAAKRVERVLRDLRMLSRCANPTSYSYSAENVETMFLAIDADVAAVKQAFRVHTQEKFTFGS